MSCVTLRSGERCSGACCHRRFWALPPQWCPMVGAAGMAECSCGSQRWRTQESCPSLYVHSVQTWLLSENFSRRLKLFRLHGQGSSVWGHGEARFLIWSLAWKNEVKANVIGSQGQPWNPQGDRCPKVILSLLSPRSDTNVRNYLLQLCRALLNESILHTW